MMVRPTSREAPISGTRLPRSVAVFIAVLVVSAITIGVLSSHYYPRWPGASWPAITVLMVSMTAAGYFHINFRHHDQVDALDLFEAALAPMIFIVHGIWVVVAVAVAKAVAEALLRVQPAKAIFNVAQWMAAASVGCFVFGALHSTNRLVARDLLPLAVAMVAVSLVNHLALIIVLRLVSGTSLRTVVAGLSPLFMPLWLVGGAVNLAVGVLFVAATAWVPLAAPLFLVPLGMLHWAGRGYAAARVERTRLRGMQRAMHMLAVPVNPRDSVPAFLAAVRDCFEAEVVDLVMRCDDGRLHRWRSRAGDTGCEHDDAEPDCLAATVAQVGSLVRVGHSTGPADLVTLLRQEGWRDCLGAPMLVGSRVNGALCSYNRIGLEGFEDGEGSVLEALAGELASALDKGKLLDVVIEDRKSFSQIVNQTSDGIAAITSDGRIQTWNPGFTRLTGYDATRMVGRRLAELRPSDADGHPFDLDRWADVAPSRPLEIQIRSRSGASRWLSCSCTKVPAIEASDPAVILTASDVTDRKRAETMLTGQALVLDRIAHDAPLSETLVEVAGVVEREVPGARCALFLLDEEGTSLRVGAAPRLSLDALAVDGRELGPDAGWAATAVLRKAPVIVPDIANAPHWKSRAATALSLGIRACWAVPVVAADRGRTIGAMALYFNSPREPSEEDLRLTSIAVRLTDIAIERRKAQASLTYQATHDHLTALANRVVFLDRASLALARTQREQLFVAVLFVDLDRFKVINDSFGHEAGDQLLIAVADRIERLLRPGDTVARFGGDEFTILCEAIADEADAILIAERVQGVLAAPFSLNGVEVFVTASIGLALGRGPNARAMALVEDADAAMYRAKELGGDRYELYDRAMRVRAMSRLATQNSLHRAIRREEFRVYYQPTVSLEHGQMISVEALVRWDHPERGITKPHEFISLAEETGLIVPIGSMVLEEACRQALRWSTAGPGGAPLGMSINLSARQFTHPDLVGLVRRALSETGLDPAVLSFEITESVLMEDAGVSDAALRALKELGVGFTIDDFGTGYSSLAYLKRFPVDGLKVDRSFVDGLGSEDDDSAIVAAVVTLAHALGLTAVAEGIETAEQLERLRELGCNAGQGYYLGRPVPPDLLLDGSSPVSMLADDADAHPMADRIVS